MKLRVLARLVSIQHVLYGWTVFSVGLDPYFLGGTLHR